VSATDAFDEVFRGEFAAVCRSAYLVCGDWSVAADATQEAFVRLLVRWGRVSRYDRPGAWVRLVAVRLALRERDRGLRRQPLAESAVDPPPPETDERLQLLVFSLPPQQRAAVVVRYWLDLPIKDVATALGCSEATARVHLHRARRKLGSALSSEENDVD
jgi:RNA polymerase sigma factor (sigma-70 family)